MTFKNSIKDRWSPVWLRTRPRLHHCCLLAVSASKEKFKWAAPFTPISINHILILPWIWRSSTWPAATAALSGREWTRTLFLCEYFVSTSSPAPVAVLPCGRHLFSPPPVAAVPISYLFLWKRSLPIAYPRRSFFFPNYPTAVRDVRLCWTPVWTAQ